MDKARRLDTVAWLVVGVLSIAGLIYAGVMSFLVLSSMDWNLFGGNLDWSPGQVVTPARPQIPPDMQLPQQQGPPAPPPGMGGPQVPPPAQLSPPPAQLPPPPPR
jgi:hypothetical protein